MKKLMYTMLVGTVVSLSACADKDEGRYGSGPRMSAQERFDMMDGNSDNAITLKELKAHHEEMKAKIKEHRQGKGDKGKGPRMTEEDMFDDMDTNSDGRVTFAEYQAHMDKMEQMRGQRKDKKRGR